jgi:membrane fusion protein, multidrug efflux system
MNKRTKLIIVVAVCVAGAAVVFRILTGNAASDAHRQTAPLVKTQKPSRENISYTLHFTGDMVAVRQASIYAKVSGNLERVYVDIGAAVRVGQLLALIDTTELYQQYQQATATFENARANYQRTKELSEQNLVARQEIDNADAAMKVARANFDLASTRLGYARITAPFHGYITKRFLDPGALVNASSTSLFSLMDLDAMKVNINVLEKDIPLIKEGTGAKVTVDAYPTQEFDGIVKRYAEAVDLSTRTMAVEVDIPNRDHLLKPGMFARVSLVVDEHSDMITVPTSSILSDNEGTFVFLARDDKARRIPVNIGIEQNERTEILKGLSGDEDIITTGQQFVKDGGPVSVQPD